MILGVEGTPPLLAVLTDSYTSTAVNKIDFTYMIHKGEVPSYEKSFLALKDVTPLASKPTHSIKRTFLPISMQPKDF